MGFENGIYTVGKNDCPWVTARSVLAQQNKKVTNSAIVAEMERLAKLNGCESVDDFSDKFYSKVGLEIKYQEQPKKELPKPIKREKSHEFEEADSTRVVMNPVIKEKSIPEDTTKVVPKPVAPEDSTKVVPKPVAPEDSTKVVPKPVAPEDSTKVEPKPVAPEDSTKVVPKPVAPEDTTKITNPEDLSDKDLNKLSDEELARRLINSGGLKSILPEDSQKSLMTPVINGLDSDIDKIQMYNQAFGKGNYVVIDKKNCKLTVYDKSGKALESYEVLLGSTAGDNMSTALAANPTLRKNTTPSGEFKIRSMTNNFGGMLNLGESFETEDPDVVRRLDMPGSGGKVTNWVNYIAIHKTANAADRDKLYGDGNLDNNRVSMGCININGANFDEIMSKYSVGIGSSVYILPEDEGNSLELRKLKDGTTKFITKYANPEQQAKVDKVQNGIAEKNYQNKLAQIKKEQDAKIKAERERILAEQERLLAEQKRKEENFRIYDPTTWYWPWA